MKRLLMLLTIESSLLFAENETITIKDENTFYKLMHEQLSEVNAKYNLNVDVLIKIDENGNLSYKIIKESDIPKFNEEVIVFLEEKTKIKFPNLNNKARTTRTTFRAENINEKPKLTNVKELK